MTAKATAPDPTPAGPPGPKGARTTNPELQVMVRVDRLLAELPDDPARARVVAWLAGHYGPKPPPAPIDPFEPADPRP